jgi:Ala-tRNA(Pro) deacylase
MTAFGIDLTLQYLDQNGASYEVLEHNITYTAAAEARVTGIPTDDVAKSVLLRGDGGYHLAIIPASERLDLRKTRQHIGDVRMASEEEMQHDFRGFELGAIPPFSSLVNAPEIIDQRLLDHKRILCCAGDHSHSLLINTQEIMRLSNPSIGDLCQD